MGFNAKNLTYESNEPAFLRKLRNEYGGEGSPRHERPMPRPRKQMKDGDEDDEPTYVVEGSQDTMSKDEYEALVGGKISTKNRERDAPTLEKDGKGGESAREEHVDPSQALEPTKELVATIGGSNKRRLPKVVGGDDEENQVREDSCPHGQKKAKPKSKKIKLSFDEETKESGRS